MSTSKEGKSGKVRNIFQQIRSKWQN